MRLALMRCLRSESGATVLEYAFIAILISVAIVSVVVQIGTQVNGMFQQVANGF